MSPRQLLSIIPTTERWDAKISPCLGAPSPWSFARDTCGGRSCHIPPVTPRVTIARSVRQISKILRHHAAYLKKSNLLHSENKFWSTSCENTNKRRTIEKFQPIKRTHVLKGRVNMTRHFPSLSSSLTYWEIWWPSSRNRLRRRKKGLR